MREQPPKEDATMPETATDLLSRPRNARARQKVAELSGFVLKSTRFFQAVLESTDGYMNDPKILQRKFWPYNRQLREMLKDGAMDCQKGDRPGELFGLRPCHGRARRFAGRARVALLAAAAIGYSGQPKHPPASPRGECLTTVRRGDHDRGARVSRPAPRRSTSRGTILRCSCFQ